jgi:hypothetical protein
MKKMNRWIGFFLVLPAFACSKTDTVSPASQTVPLVTAAGAAAGPAVHKTIGTAGGTITSADGNITITIPSGALAGDEELTVQPVVNQLPAGYGKAYRLTPHEIHFLKPVTIHFRYDENIIKNTLPELLGIAYQDQNGKWFHAAEPVLDKENRMLSVSTIHFSDWGFFPYFYIDPGEVLVDPGAQLDLHVMATTRDELPDLPRPNTSPVMQPYQPGNEFLGTWNYAGGGSLEGQGNKAHYQAPNSVPRINPEAVSVAVKPKRKGQFLLVSNITIRTEFHIDYMQVDETERHAGGLDYESRLWIYGSFGEDPGKEKRKVKINNGEVIVALWTPGMIACDIPAVGPSSSGMVEVTSGEHTAGKMLNEWVIDMFYDQKQSPDGALTKKVNIVLHIRGDADGFFRQGQVPMVHKTDLHNYCKGIIEMPAGSFTNHVSVDACGDYTVAWDAIHNLIVDRKTNTDPGNNGLRGEVINQPGGFDIKIRFIAEDVLMTHRRFADCVSGSTLDHVQEYVQIEGFHEATIPLRFSASDSRAFVKAGQMPVRTGSPAAGLYWDAQDYNPSQFTINLRWNETAPKF